jgi:hypothetical protein
MNGIEAAFCGRVTSESIELKTSNQRSGRLSTSPSVSATTCSGPGSLSSKTWPHALLSS